MGSDSSVHGIFQARKLRHREVQWYSLDHTAVLCVLSHSVVSDSLWFHGLEPARFLSVQGILQTRILEWMAMPSSRGSSQPRDVTQVSCTAGRFFTIWATRETHEYQSGSVQLCPTLCDPVDCSVSGFRVHHQLRELTQTHVHWVGDVIQPSHLLSSPSPPAFNLSQHQGLFQWVSSSNQVAKVLEL